MKSKAELAQELRELREKILLLEAEMAGLGVFEVDSLCLSRVWQALNLRNGVFVVITDREGNFLDLNGLAKGFVSDDIAVNNAFALTKAEYRPALREAFDTAWTKQEPASARVKDSQHDRWFYVHLAPIIIEGKVIALLHLTEDLSENYGLLNQIRSWESRLAFLLEQLPVIAWSVDRDLKFTSSRGAGLTLLQLLPDQVVGQSLYQFFEENRKSWEVSFAAHQKALTGVPVTYEQAWGEYTFQSFVTPLQNEAGEIVGVVGLAVDISQRKQEEVAMRSNLSLLELRVAERTRELERANQSLLNERVVLQRLVELHERDRQFTAFEIHDGLVQDLSASLLFFESSASEIAALSTHARESYDQGRNLLRQTIQEARRIMNGISPHVLDEYGLVEAIYSHVELFSQRSGIEVEIEEMPENFEAAPSVELGAYRIVQESLNNIWKHSGAQRATLRLHAGQGRLEITVRDLGRGFRLEGVDPSRYGLMSIRERARLLGGEGKIESTPGEGTTVIAWLPTDDILLKAKPTTEAP